MVEGVLSGALVAHEVLVAVPTGTRRRPTRVDKPSGLRQGDRQHRRVPDGEGHHEQPQLPAHRQRQVAPPHEHPAHRPVRFRRGGRRQPAVCDRRLLQPVAAGARAPVRILLQPAARQVDNDGADAAGAMSVLPRQRRQETLRHRRRRRTGQLPCGAQLRVLRHQDELVVRRGANADQHDATGRGGRRAEHLRVWRPRRQRLRVIDAELLQHRHQHLDTEAGHDGTSR